MKKIFAATLFFILFSTEKIIAQQDSSLAYNSRSSTISAGYGFLSVWKTALSLANFQLGTYAIGPCVVRYEYGISKRISAGITGGYAELKENDGYGSVKLTDFFIVGAGSYHFCTSKKLDPYIRCGFGYYRFKFDTGNGDVPVFFTLPGPFAISLAAGTKYYFNHHLGAYAEAGYDDGGIIQVGFTYKVK